MKIIFLDFKKGQAKVKITNLDDIWCLSQIVDKGDIVQGDTLRKIKLGSGEKQKAARKPVFLSIAVEKAEFHKQSDILRIAGTIEQGPDDVPKGSHHTFNVEINSIITIIKEKWLDFQKEKLKQASTENQPKILLVVFDRDEAHFAYAKTYGYEYLSEIKSDLPKKGEENKKEGTYYEDIIKKLKEYVVRYNIEKIIAASPAFWKEYLLKKIKEPELKEKIITAACSSADKTAFNEVMKRPEVETALKESRASEEMRFVDELLKEILQGKKAKYGFKDVENAANAGAVNILLITDSYIMKMREENNFEKVDVVLKTIDNTKGRIIIVSSEHEGGKKLDGLGGIAAILRYQID